MTYDVIVVGARCAGSPLAMLLARAGARVLLVDRMEFPSDVVNGHMVKPAGIARLAKWGLLERVMATGTVPIRRKRVVIGEDVMERTLGEGEPPMAAPRRYLLDTILVEAAADAGAEVRTQTSMRGLVVENGRVAGVRLEDRSGHADVVQADMVVGADGRNSRVAEQAGSKAYHDDGVASVVYWSYWSGVVEDSVTLYLGEGIAAGTFPTNDEQSVAFIQARTDWRDKFRRDSAAAYEAAVRAAPIIGDLLDGARRESRVLGMVSLPNFFRQAYGPGWALCGDAGHHKDPLAARGISDAFRDAERLAHALTSGLAGNTRDLEAELGSYARDRDEAAADVYRLNLELSRLRSPLSEARSVFIRMTEAELTSDRAFPPQELGLSAATASAEH